MRKLVRKEEKTPLRVINDFRDPALKVELSKLHL